MFRAFCLRITDMKYILAVCGIALSFYMVKHRESIGNSLGEYEWMRKFGGIYAAVVIAAFIVFLFSIATITGTEEAFFAPVFWLLPFLRQTPDTSPPPEFLYP